MVKKILVLLLGAVSAVCLAAGIAACDSGSSHQHTMQHTAAVAATCVSEGNTEYYYCSGCNQYFSDSAGNNVITLESTVIAATGKHTAENGYSYDAEYHWNTCSVCEQTFNKTAHTLDADGKCGVCGVSVISTAAQLKAMHSNTEYVLANDIDLGGEEWTPLDAGTDSYFILKLNGNGHSIKNFKITTFEESEAYSADIYIGLFTQCSGSITNLGIEDFEITISYSTSKIITMYVGALGGNAYNLSAENCHVKGEITVSYTSSSTTDNMVYAGGFAGSLCSSYSNAFTDCYSATDIAVSAVSGKTSTYVGGIAGNVCSTSAISLDITNCYSTGTITASARSTSSATSTVCKSETGGIAGSVSKVKITGSYSAATVSGTVNAYKNGYSDVGGLAGEVTNATISDCYATGAVTSTLSASNSTTSSYCSCAGGLVGKTKTASESIQNSYATGAVTAAASNECAYAGGFIGLIEVSSSNIKNCFATGDVTATYGGSSTATNAYAGGFVGNGTPGTNYRSSTQTVTGGTVSETGTAASVSDLQSSTYLTGTLGFSSDVWAFGTNAYPTLKAFAA